MFYVCILFYISQERTKNIVDQSPIIKSQIATKPFWGLPVHLIIPMINVDTTIQSFGVNPKGEMDISDDIVDVGWFKLGSRPGEKGSAVIAGHLDGIDGQTGVFINLDKLKTGDKLYVEDENKKLVTFVVRESQIYDPGYAEEVFSPNDDAHLNLITCDGLWNGIKKEYSKRLVVFTDLLK